MPRSRLSSLLLLAALLAPGVPSAARTDSSDAEALMRDSTLWQQLETIAPTVRGGLLDALSKQPDRPQPGEVQRLSRAVERAYAAGRLQAIARETLAEQLSPRHLDAIHAWFESPAGVAIHRAEAAAAADRREQEVIIQDGVALLAQAPPSRRDLLRELVSETRAAEAAASIVISTAIALQRGAASAGPALPGPSDTELRDMLESERPRMVEALRESSLALDARAFATVSEDELGAYLAFAKSDAGRHFTAASMQALTSALLDAGLKLGRKMAGPEADPGI